eukprot:CAMPEP_0206387774 /NCGR_PEP_ID=MMETSP0294-20121207/16838_1 /ASSEMBLY_ACC=CAM_ASM_000327 /TAXON_ID=39354 /ORGANISM="Heterosigma akashiwo, Strain CCMP2393" /LENGTH=408 /DNA_ID=CAMNT_0053839275 /DNA_START=295 /DNA_END=1521 /DNA_ORIENTATION=+
MGATSSSDDSAKGGKSSILDQLTVEIEAQSRRNGYKKPSHALTIQHFIPPTFPLHPLISNKHLREINKSWKLIKDGKAEGLSYGTGGRSGMVFFFDEFYNRLFQRSATFREYFGQDIRKRGEVLLRIVQFVGSLDLADRSKHKRLAVLGKNHISKNIKPWMYSVFVEVLIETMMYCLGSDGDYLCSQAWNYVMAYIMERMLMEAIRSNQNIDFEFNANAFKKGHQMNNSMNNTRTSYCASRTSNASSIDNSTTSKAKKKKTNNKRQASTGQQNTGQTNTDSSKANSVNPTVPNNPDRSRLASLAEGNEEEKRELLTDHSKDEETKEINNGDDLPWKPKKETKDQDDSRAPEMTISLLGTPGPQSGGDVHLNSKRLPPVVMSQLTGGSATSGGGGGGDNKMAAAPGILV